MPKTKPRFLQRDREERRSNGPAPVDQVKAAFVANLGQPGLGVPVTSRTVMGIAAFRNGVALISEGVAGTPLFPAMKGAEGGYTPAIDHPCYDLLTHAPNAYMTAFDLWSALLVNALVNGLGLASISRFDGEISGFHLLPSGYQPKVEEGRVVYRKGNDAIDAADCLAIRGLSWDGFNILSPTETNRDTLGTTLSENRHQQALLANGATPHGHIETSGPGYNTTEQRKQLRESWDKQHGGPDNAGGVGILHNAKWVNTTLSPIDLQIIESKGFGVAELARILGVPAWMLSAPGTEPPSSTEEGMTQFARLTLRPWYVRIQQELALKLLSPIERRTMCFQHDEAGLTIGDNRSRTETVKTMVSVGVWSINEGREFLGMNPIDDPRANYHLFQANNLQALETAPLSESTQPATNRPNPLLPQPAKSGDDQ